MSSFAQNIPEQAPLPTAVACPATIGESDEKIAPVVPASAAILASAAASPLQNRPSLEDIDKALAANLDVMLHGEITSIEAVLEDATSVQGGSVQQIAEVPAAESALPSRRHAVNQPPSQGAVQTPPEVQEQVTVDAPLESESSQPVLDAASQAREEDSSSPPPAEPVVANAQDEPSPVQQTVTTSAAPQSSTTIEINVPRQPPHIPVGTGLPAALEVTSIDAPRSSPEIISTMRRGVCGILAKFNVPLQMIPAPYRPFADWVAISLALWVPVVWVVSVMNVRAAGEAIHTADDDVHTSQTSHELTGETASESTTMHETSVLQNH